MKNVERDIFPKCDFCDKEAEVDCPINGRSSWAYICKECLPERSCPVRKHIGYHFVKPKPKAEIGLGHDQIHPMSIGAVILAVATEEKKHRPIHIIAADIKKAWKNVYFGAVPYLDAMFTLDSIDGNYGMDSGRSIVAYFLSNAQSFRGPEARKLKAELKGMLK